MAKQKTETLENIAMNAETDENKDKWYIITDENGVITEYGLSSIVPKNAEIVSDIGEMKRGDKRACYDDKGNRFPLEELIAKGLVEKELTELEKYERGILPLPKGQKLVNGELVAKTNEEMFADGEITTEEYASIKRAERDRFLEETDKYLLSDYPISESDLERVKAYRQMLRDLPTNENFPNVEIEKFVL